MTSNVNAGQPLLTASSCGRSLSPYATRHNTKISGPEVVLRTEAGQAIAMVLHELATNAAKYGLELPAN